MHIYQLKLDVLFFNILIFGDRTLDSDMKDDQFLDQDLTQFGFPGTIMIGTSPSSLSVVANNSESIDPESGELDPETLRKVEVIVDEDGKRRDDAFFEYLMPVGAEGLLTTQVSESDLLPIGDDENVYIPVP